MLPISLLLQSLLLHLIWIFNYIYNTGGYPISWTKGTIVPIYKKGDKSDPSNYRGITLVNNVAKLFSLVLRNRINTWCENENIYCNEQFGFRNNSSTADCVFILHTIIQNVISHNSKLYCAFIDYEKAFDTVIHDALWIKLVSSGLSCKMLPMIKSMYKKVTSCIKNADNMSYSELFDVSVGVKQGEPLSPLLFILFINDIKVVSTLPSLPLQLLHVYIFICCCLLMILIYLLQTHTVYRHNSIV